MKKRFFEGIPLLLMAIGLSGCNFAGERTASVSVIYGAAAVISLLLLAGCICLVRKKDPWFVVLFSCVFVVNIGYLLLSASATVDEALWANRIAYLGSAFLPVAMIMIILRACKLKFHKWFVALLLCIAFVMFLIAASPGYLDIYYKEVSLVVTNNVSTLKKVYGPWHLLYTIYLMCTFSAMLASIVHAAVKRKVSSLIHAMILLAAVFVNLGVWLIEQFVHLDFEFLSISYIISELFLLGVYMMLQEWQREQTQNICKAGAAEPVKSESKQPGDGSDEQYRYFCEQIKALTPTEHRIFCMYVSGKTTKEILSELGIKENTLKFHNKNIYSKLGVTSRKQLCRIAQTMQPND